MEFREWLLLSEHTGSPGSKQSLYPLGYGGVGLYTPPDIITWSADAVTYMPVKDRQLKFKWGDGMLAKPEGLELPDVPHEEEGPETGKPNFKWGQGMRAKPKDLVDTIKTLHTQPRDSFDRVTFIWGKGMLSKPPGLTDQ